MAKKLYNSGAMAEFAEVQKKLRQLADPQQAAILQRFFKTGKGEYGEGDVFLGIKVPVLRAVAKKYPDLSLADVQRLLKSNIHEYRLVAILMLVGRFERGSEVGRRRVYNLYLKNARHINNWDLVDLSAPNIVGSFLLDKPRRVLYKLARSRLLWERRIAMLATFTFIRNNDFKCAFALAEILLHDKHDLMHKAVGWMLREIGKRDQKALGKFLQKHYKAMPRTMLRYAIERLSSRKKKYYMAK